MTKKLRSPLIRTLELLEVFEWKEYGITRLQQPMRMTATDLRPIVKELVKHGLLKSTRKKVLSGWTIDVFSITSKGRKALEKWKLIKEMFGAEKLEDLA